MNHEFRFWGKRREREGRTIDEEQQPGQDSYLFRCLKAEQSHSAQAMWHSEPGCSH